MKPVVSIVMPVFNVAAFVAESIQSVRSQTWSDWELIVINDGSTDATEAVVRSLAAGEPRIRLLSRPQGGAASARNLGLDLAGGAYLAFLDGDDLWREGFLAGAVAMLEAGGTDYLLCGVERLHPDGSRRPVAMTVPAGVSSAESLLDRHFAGGAPLLMGNVMLRATPALRGFRFKDGCRHGEDTEYLLRALATARAASFLEEPLFRYRFRPGSATHQAWDWRFWLDAIHAMERVLEHLVQPGCACSGPTADGVRRRLRHSKYRLLYQMVKSGAWSEARALMDRGGWREALRSVAQQEGLLHRFKARIVLGQDPRIWGLVAFYARNRFWASAR